MGILYRCLFCGAPSWIDPSDQIPPPDYCHPIDHGQCPDDIRGFQAREIGEGDWFDVPLNSLQLILEFMNSPHYDYRWMYHCGCHND